MITFLIIVFTIALAVYAAGAYIVVIGNTSVEQRMKAAPTSDKEAKRIFKMALTWPLWFWNN
jgi:hypothetical protein